MDGRASDDGLPAPGIAAARAAFVAGLRSRDAAAAAAVYADDARLLAPSVELLEGRGSIAAFWEAGVAAGISDVELVTLRLEVGVGLAYEIGRYTLRLDPAEGRPVVDCGKYVLVHRLEPDGCWRRAVEMFNPDAAPDGRMQRECNVDPPPSPAE